MGARWQACEQRRVGASTCSKNRRRGGRRARAACRRGQSRAAADVEDEGDHAAGGPGLGPSAPAIPRTGTVIHLKKIIFNGLGSFWDSMTSN